MRELSERTSKQIEQELSYLFGENWLDFADADAFAFALSRIRKRQKQRKSFFIHLLFFIPVNVYLAVVAWMGVVFNATILIAIEFAVTPVWLLLLIRNAQNTFPSKERLIRREKQAWNELQEQSGQIRPGKPKRKEKPKRDLYYTLGDDGEIIELEEDSELSDEKPKRPSNKLV